MEDTKSLITRWLGEACSSGESDRYRFRRRRMRFAWKVALEVRVGDRTMPAVGCNLSCHGAAFLCETPIPCDTRIGIHRAGDSGWVPVRVTHCSKSSDNFVVGGRFETAGEGTGPAQIEMSASPAAGDEISEY